MLKMRVGRRRGEDEKGDYRGVGLGTYLIHEFNLS